MKILCIIPARSGSRGIKNKNLQKVRGLTLLERAYLFSKKIKEFNNIVVSTDSKKYLSSLKKHNYKLLYLRPKALAGDNATDLQVMIYETKRYEKIFKIKFNYIALLQPTSPIRKLKKFKEYIKILKNKKPDALWTVSKVDKKYNPIKQLVLKKNLIEYYSKSGKTFKSRQLLSDTYIRNGIAYFFSRKTLLKLKTILPKKTLFQIINYNYVNIDTYSDLRLARHYLK